MQVPNERLSVDGDARTVAEVAKSLFAHPPGLPLALATEVVLDGGELGGADRLLDLAFGGPEKKVCRQEQQIVINVKEIETETSIGIGHLFPTVDLF